MYDNIKTLKKTNLGILSRIEILEHYKTQNIQENIRRKLLIDILDGKYQK